LVPYWWKQPLKQVPATFNARVETVADKPMFRASFKARRCIIPASGYYEWQDTERGKQPWYFVSALGTESSDGPRAPPFAALAELLQKTSRSPPSSGLGYAIERS